MGSSPMRITKTASLAQLVEHDTLNVGVQGSSPWGSTKEFRNELLFLLSAHSEHLKLLQCIGKFIRIHKNVGKSVGKIILN